MSFYSIIHFFRLMRDSRLIDKHDRFTNSVPLVSKNLNRLSSKDTHRYLKYLVSFERVTAELADKYNLGGESNA